MSEQMELFKVDCRMRHFRYWKDQLRKWPREVFEWRHHRNTTGWSMATGGFSFAEFLVDAGEMNVAEFKRWQRFARRVARWDLKGGDE